MGMEATVTELAMRRLFAGLSPDQSSSKKKQSLHSVVGPIVGERLAKP